MSDDIYTDPAARPVPAWAQDIFRGSAWGDFMPAERALLDAAIVLLRARAGRSGAPDPKATARLFISDALAALDGEAGR